jgi:competence protein CoiA
MKFALVNGIKQEPAPKLKGVCCNCGTITQAKCGTRKVWHWAHVTLQHCDSWWEGETEWHRLWKGYFSYQNQEVIHFDDATGEKHIADIKTNNGMVIEIQNSPMNEAEMLSRERFYGKMMWIINGEKFKNNFIILGKLPDPKSQIAQDVFFQRPFSETSYWEINNDREKLIDNSVVFFLKSENPNYEASYQEYLKSKNRGIGSGIMVLPPGKKDRDRVLKEIQSYYIGHHLFIWKNPRTVWLQSAKPVFIDFGGNDLWRLMDYDYRGIECVRRISKTALIEKNGGCYVSSTDATTASAPANNSLGADW